MLKPHKLCKICNLIKENPQLEKDIYNTTYYIRNAKNSLAEVTRKYEGKFTYNSLKNHTKNHQFLSKSETTKKTLQNTKKKREVIAREKSSAQDVWDNVIQYGMDELKRGELQIKTQDLLKAVKDKSDYELKVNDQKLAYAEMMWHFASGESSESKSYDRRVIKGQEADYYDPTQTVTGDSGAGENESSNLHNATPWDAIASGSTSLPEPSQE